MITHRQRFNEDNGNWKGNSVGYFGLHDWVRARIAKPNDCTKCGKNGFIELSNISHQYKRDLTDWEYICRSCHASYHNRTKNFNSVKPWSNKNRRINRICQFCSKEFNIIISVLKRANRGKFCSRQCSDKGRGKL